jgi:HAD superfamily hydrolase (TIGR01549 family)
VAPPAAVLFDVDDTLFDHRFSTRAALDHLQDEYPCLHTWPAAVFEQRNSDLLEQYHLDVLAGRLDVDTARRLRFARLFEEAGHALTCRALDEVTADYRAAYTAAMRSVPGALPLLKALAPRARLGVVTNNVVDQQLHKLDVLGLRPYLDAVVISEAVGFQKPDPRIFLLALDELGCAPREAVMVGDSWQTDIPGALAAGLAPVWFNPKARPRPGGLEYPDVPELRSFEPVGCAVAVVLDAVPGPDGHRRKE